MTLVQPLLNATPINSTPLPPSPPFPPSLSSEAKKFLRNQTESKRKLKKITKKMGDHQNEQPIVVSPNPDDQLLQDSTEPTKLFAMLRLNSFRASAPASAVAATATDVCNHHTPCTNCGYSGATNPMKRRSPSSCLSLQDPSMAPTDPESEPRAKKQFFEKDELTNHGFSSITLPLSLGTLPNENPGPVLRRCSSDPCNPPGATTGGGFPVTPFHSPDHANTVANPATPPSIRGSSSGLGLPPLPRSLKRCVSDPTPSPVKSFSRSCSSGDMGVDLSKEETHSSMRLRRMKDRLKEMRQWWDEVMRDETEEDCEEAEDDKMLSKNECGSEKEESEEAVSVEWAEKCLSIHFKCPCGKGYKILFSGNNCYYKLV